MTAVAWNRPDALRVNQLDANQLDCELAELVAAQLVTALRVAWPAVSVYTSEAAAVSEAVLLLGSVAQGTPSPGAALVGLKYSPGLNTKQRLTLLSAVAVEYLWRLAQLHNSGRSGGVSRVALRALEASHTAASLCVTLHFVLTGRFRRVLDALAGVHYAHSRPDVSRVVSFELLNRHLAWQELSTLLLVILPLASASRRRMGAHGGGALSALLGRTAGAEERTAASAKPRAHACVVCARDAALLPTRMVPCGHVGCFYCVSARCCSEASFLCPTCGARADKLSRLGPDG